MLSTIKDLEIGEKKTVGGCISTVQEHKDFYIVKITDHAGQQQLQLIFDLSKVKLYYREQPIGISRIVELVRGLHILVTGDIVKPSSGTEALEMQVEKAVHYGQVDQKTYPFPKLKKGQKVDIVPLRQMPSLRFHSAIFQRIMAIRHTCSLSTHKFFDALGMLWMTTPILTAADCEGAGETHFIEGGREFFGTSKPPALTVSGQLHGEAAALSLIQGIYTFGPTFRAEHSSTTRHLAEFWMVEPEKAWLDLDGLVEMATHYVTYVLRKVLKKHRADLLELGKFFKEDEQFLLKRYEMVADGFKTITYTEAVDEIKKIYYETPSKKRKQLKFKVEELVWGVDLSSDMEKTLVKHFSCPVVVTHYPKQIKSFYMYEQDGCEPGKETVQAMDVLFPDIGEMIGGSVREYRHEVLKKRMDDMGIDIPWYLQLRKISTVPHAGFGLGFERLVMYATGAPSVHDVIPYPRQYKGMHC